MARHAPLAISSSWFTDQAASTHLMLPRFVNAQPTYECEGWAVVEHHISLLRCSDGSTWAGFDVHGQSVLGAPYRAVLPARAVAPNSDGALTVSNHAPSRPLTSS